MVHSHLFHFEQKTTDATYLVLEFWPSAPLVCEVAAVSNGWGEGHHHVAGGAWLEHGVVRSEERRVGQESMAGGEADPFGKKDDKDRVASDGGVTEVSELHVLVGAGRHLGDTAY